MFLIEGVYKQLYIDNVGGGTDSTESTVSSFVGGKYFVEIKDEK